MEGVYMVITIRSREMVSGSVNSLMKTINDESLKDIDG